MFERRYFIVAPNFHGTTLLSKLLNDHPEIISLGDTYPSNRLDQICGCGEYVSQCPFWNSVAERVGSERYRMHPHLLPDYPAITGNGLDRILYNTLGPQVLERVIPKIEQEAFATDFETFQSAVYEHSSQPTAKVFVDCVKSISRVYALIASGVHVDGVIHLYRTPGDYIKSSMQQEGQSWQVFVSRMLKQRFFHWLARRTAEWVPYLSVTYEGLADDPDGTMDALFRFLQVSPKPMAELVAREWNQPWHFMGNASLFQFDGTIRQSRHKLTLAEQRMVHLINGRYEPQKFHVRSRP